jgi:hypothetical protein
MQWKYGSAYFAGVVLYARLKPKSTSNKPCFETAYLGENVKIK